MSRSIELSDEEYAGLERAAEMEGITPAEWIARRIPRWADADFRSSSEGQPVRTMADRLAGRIGRFHSGNGQPSSDNLRESFSEYLEEKHRAGHL
jgi:hypothetical protein